jgi:hypothetical protein
MNVRLKKEFFTETYPEGSEREGEFFRWHGLSASLFVYSSGVRAVRISSDLGHIVLLPFRGQQIWDAHLRGRRLTMRSRFPQPKETDFFLNTYGCFMMHCGALRMGGPGPGDDHPLHGELPYAPYQDAGLVFGEDADGRYLGLTGSYEHDVAFSAHYTARPRVVLYEGTGLIDISLTIDNRSAYPMELMYMCHVNFLPVAGGRIVQSVPWDAEHMRVRTNIPSHTRVSESFMAFLKRLEDDPSATRVIREEDEYRPEVALYIDNPTTDSDGYCHYMQVHPDGAADYVAYRPDELDHATRWIMRTEDQEALGIALPATCEPEGYTAEKGKGNVREIEGYGSRTFSVRTGALDPAAAGDMEKHITDTLQAI